MIPDTKLVSSNIRGSTRAAELAHHCRSCQLNYSIFIKKSETTHHPGQIVHKAISVRKQFFSPTTLRGPWFGLGCLDLGKSTTNSFQMCTDKYLQFGEKTLVLASLICLPGNFQFKLKQSINQRDGTDTGKHILYCWLALFSSFLLSAHLLISSHTEGKVWTDDVPVKMKRKVSEV